MTRTDTSNGALTRSSGVCRRRTRLRDRSRRFGDMSSKRELSGQPLLTETARDNDAAAREAVGRAHADPALPPIGREQSARGLLDALAIGAAACVALGFAERATVEATRHRRSLSVGWSAPATRVIVSRIQKPVVGSYRDGMYACSGAEASAIVSRLTPDQWHTSPNQAYGTSLPAARRSACSAASMCR